MGRLKEIEVVLQTPTDWGAVTVLERIDPDPQARMVKAVVAPLPVLTMQGSLWVPDRHGKIVTGGVKYSGYPWEVIFMAGRQADIKILKTVGVSTYLLRPKSEKEEYYNLLLGQGLLRPRLVKA